MPRLPTIYRDPPPYRWRQSKITPSMLYITDRITGAALGSVERHHNDGTWAAVPPIGSTTRTTWHKDAHTAACHLYDLAHRDDEAPS